MKITKLTVENLTEGCVTDNAHPRVSFAFASDKDDVKLERAEITVGVCSIATTNQILVPYDGAPLKPFTAYPVTVTATDNHGESDTACTMFETGRLGTPWQAKWITDGEYRFTEKRVSPTPLAFRKKLNVEKPLSRAVIYSTAIGIYELFVNGKRAGDRYFAPGFTSYKTTLQYQTYDITEMISCGVGKRRYIWHTPSLLHFGDWVAPDEPKMSGWQKRSKWTATASLYHTSAMLARIARVLGHDVDASRYSKLAEKVADAYMSVFTDGNGKLKTEFQTAYVLPLAFGMFPESRKKAAVDNLAALVEKNEYCIGTGFPGTPFILFALADNGRADVAFKMLENDKCPSWLYEVKAGGTTVWERWDALRADGSVNTGSEDGTGGMISFNHYASGAVGEFLYRRIAGIEPVDCGYKAFKIEPLIGGSLTHAESALETPYGRIESAWKIENGKFVLNVTVPASAECTVVLPNGERTTVGSGKRRFEIGLD